VPNFNPLQEMVSAQLEKTMLLETLGPDPYALSHFRQMASSAVSNGLVEINTIATVDPIHAVKIGAV